MTVGPSFDATDAAISRIAATQDDLHAFITVASETAVEAAHASDARRLSGDLRGPLDGVCIAIKDNIAIKGVARTNGTRAFAKSVSDVDATVTARLLAAGAVLIGTTNMHEGALGATTDNPFWGRCDNPAATGHTPGGSSGGSAAAVAAGLVPLALGTDTMGSVRIPAAYCGLWGLKPTRGLIPVRGLAHLSWTLDTIGPIAADPEILAEALAVLATPDPAETSLRLPPDWSVPATPPDLASMVLGIPDILDTIDLEPAVQDGFVAFTNRLAQAGLSLRKIPVPGWDPSPLRRAGLLISEVEASILLDDAISASPDGFSDAFKSMIAHGRSAPAPKLARSYRILHGMAAAVARALEQCDALLLPTAPQRAFRHGDPVPVTQADFTALANATGLPALAFPLPTPPDGRPLSAQLIGPALSDPWLIAVARSLLST